MTKTEQLTAVAEHLSDEQIDALLSLARSMASELGDLVSNRA